MTPRRRVTLALALIVVALACTTPEQAFYSAYHSYGALLNQTSVYATRPDADPSLVAEIRAVDETAKPAIASGLQAHGLPAGPQRDAQLNAATAALTQLDDRLRAVLTKAGIAPSKE